MPYYLSMMIHLLALIAAYLCSELHVTAFSSPRLSTSSFFSRQHHHNFLSATTAATELKNETPSFSLAYPLTQVVSDIDDTLKSSGGVTVAGVSLGTMFTL